MEEAGSVLRPAGFVWATLVANCRQGTGSGMSGPGQCLWAWCEVPLGWPPALGPDLRPCCHPPDQHILRDLEKKKILVFTPSRRVGGKRVVCYDDRFIVKLAYESDGVVVSNDTYRDLQGERQEWKRFIEERLLMYSFVNDK